MNYPKNPQTNWEIRGHFWCSHSPLRFNDDRYLVIDPTGDYVAEIFGEDSARVVCERWNRYGGDLVSCSWQRPDENAPDSDRGRYTVSVKGMPSLTRSFGGGWHSDSEARRYSTELRNFIATQRILGEKLTTLQLGSEAEE